MISPRVERWLLWCGVSCLGLALAYSALALASRPTRTLPVAQFRAQLERATDTISEAVVDTKTSVTGVNTIPVPILMYHYVRDVDATADPLGYRLSVSPAEFAKQLDAIQAAGYETITPSQFLAGDVTDESIILSFDDGYRDFYETAYPILRQHEMTAVLFVVSGFVDDKDHRYVSADQVKELAKAGIEIGAHSVSHANLATVDAAQRQDELLKSRFFLEGLIGKRILSVAYPSGEYNDDVIAMARFVGYRFGVTTEAGVTTRGDAELLSLPRLAVTGGKSVDELMSALASATSGAGLPSQLRPE